MSYETETVVTAVRAAQQLLGERLDPASPGTDRDTLTRILYLLDNDRFNRALDFLERRFEHHNVTDMSPPTLFSFPNGDRK
jgi:hypothetical protein